MQQAQKRDQRVYTGDVCSDFVIHRKQQFRWLNGEIGHHMNLYLPELGVNMAEIDVFAQKSWPTVCNKENGKVEEHIHENAHFSCVYYLSVDESNYSGNLYLKNPNPRKLRGLPLPIRRDNSNNEKYHQVIPEKNKLVIFPSYLPHYVSVYNGEDYRYSISYDLTITARAEMSENEHQVSHPGQWTAIGDIS